jgi:hypothetical protein
MIKTIVAEQILSYEPVAHVLEQRLDIIQKQWHCKVINVIETKVCACPGCSDQAFIILYDDGEDPGATKGEE